MKAKKYYPILVVITGILCVPVPGRIESPPLGNRSFLIGHPHPGLGGVDNLHVDILRLGTEPNKDGLIWEELQTKINNKFSEAGIKLTPGVAGNFLEIPELRIYIDMLKLEDSQQYVFRVQTSLARSVCLTKERSPVFKADIWMVNPTMQPVSVRNMPSKVTNIVLEQVEVFILACKAANPPGKQPSDTRTRQNDSPSVSEKTLRPDLESADNKYEYVASKSSNIFHKPECRWAKNISAQNFVSYKNRDAAVKDGKRACKSCEP